MVVAEREKAREIADYREAKAREAVLAKTARVSLEGLAQQIKNEGTKQLDIILKGDVQGSVEVINDLLMKLSGDQVRIKVLRYSVGAITESDVLLAAASNAIIIGFNVRPERKAQEMADQEKVDIRLHSIIYELQMRWRSAMTGLLDPHQGVHLGRAEVRHTFRIPKSEPLPVATYRRKITRDSNPPASGQRGGQGKSLRSSASRMTRARCSAAWSAASASTITTMSRSAMSSRPTSPRGSPPN